MIGAISEALIRRMPDRISETAPGRTPIAVARPPLVLPGFCSPRSINLMSSMAHLFRISEIIGDVGRRQNSRYKIDGSDELGARACGCAAGIPCLGHVLCGDR